MIELLIVGWIVCGVASYGLQVNYSQVNFPEIARETLWDDRIKAAVFSVAGPINLVTFLIMYWSDGVRLGWRL